MRVELADEAELDLETIADFIARDNAAQALEFVMELRTTCDRLALFPRRFPLVRSDDQSGIRKALHGSYLIFFKIEEETVFVIHILHAAMDYESRLFEP
jgi:toxin ParE1/3/4